MNVMTSRRTEKYLPVMQAERALEHLGVKGAAFEQRDVENQSWFADWDGVLADSDVYIGIMGGSPEGKTVRVLLDDWTFDGVPADHLEEFLKQIFCGHARIKKERSFLILSSHVLHVSAGATSHSAGRDFRPDGELVPWERRLVSG
ncbi:hypothetical protein [uncultured Streptomyces sp.]|uniref:hypothetical protein n=1 Tax=uncultured Streptomyces sp. TaxID=174707 RepID=UPI002612B7A1|nr:hypothetical protein [uncultured Streptomyces sp.]